MPTRMVTPKITEVSGVKRAANLTVGWAVMKSLDPDIATTLAKAEATATGADITKEIAPMEITDEERAALPENVRKYLEGMEADVAKSQEEPQPDLSDQEKFEKAMSTLPEEVQSSIRKSQRDAAEAMEKAQRLEDEKANAHYTEVVKSFSHVPEITEDFAPVLRKFAETDGEAYTKLAKVLGAAEAVIKESEAFKEVGSTSTVVAGSGMDGLQKIAKSLQEADPKMSDVKALAEAALTPEGRKLAAQHRRESARRED
jgi:hypothetical protein